MAPGPAASGPARPGVSATTPRSLDALTGRERELTAKVAEGLSDEETAGLPYLSPLTVRTHAHRATAELQARDRARLVVISYLSGLVRAPGTR